MSNLKKLASQTAIYGISSNLGRLLNYVLVPFHTAIFQPEAYGIMSDFYAKAAFFNIIYTYGMETAYFRFASKSTADRQEVYNMALSAILLTSALLSTLLIVFSRSLAHLMDYPDHYSTYVIWFSLLFAADAIVAIPFARLRQENKAGKFAFVRTFNIVLNVGLNFFFLWFCRKVYEGEFLPALKPAISYIYSPTIGVGYVFLSNLVANLCIIPMLWRYFADFRFAIHEKLKPMLNYAYPILFTGLAGAINEVLSRDMLKYWLPEGFYPGRSNLDAVGIFSACYKFSIFITLAVQAFKYAAEPFFFSKAEDKNSPQLFARVMKYFIIICAFMYVGVSANLELLQYLFLRKPEYSEGLIIVPFLLVANLFLGVYYNLTVWFKLTDRTYYGTIISFIGAVITIVGNLLLVPRFGYVGSAITTLLCYFLMTVICYVLGQKYYYVPYDVKSAFGYLAFATVLVLVAFNVRLGSQVANHTFHALLPFVYIAVFWLLERKNFVRVRKAG